MTHVAYLLKSFKKTIHIYHWF